MAPDPHSPPASTVIAEAQPSRRPGAAWALTLFLLGAPLSLSAQRPCPKAPFPGISPEGAPSVILVARLTGIMLDREPPDQGARPYVSMQHTILTYQPLAELLGHRTDRYHDFVSELPGVDGLVWTVGTTYLLVLIPLPDSIPAERSTYWTAACYGTQAVAGVDEARRVLEMTGRR